MSENINLTQEEIREITGKQRFNAQTKALINMRLTVKQRPDGAPVVARSNYMRVFDGDQQGRKQKAEAPNFEALTSGT